MKVLLILLVLSSFDQSVIAQHERNRLSVGPVVGMNFTNIYTDQKFEGSENSLDLSISLEYLLVRSFGIGVQCSYARFGEARYASMQSYKLGPHYSVALRKDISIPINIGGGYQVLERPELKRIGYIYGGSLGLDYQLTLNFNVQIFFEFTQAFVTKRSLFRRELRNRKVAVAFLYSI